jgi:hypothetical protein
MSKNFSPKPLGLILREAGLITPAQVEVALQDQQYYQLPLGEILSLHGWIRQETADFFAEAWPTLFLSSYLQPLGYYLKSAALLSDEQIELILEEQKQLGIRFGALAVLKGWVSQTTIDYFLENLLADAKSVSDFQHKNVGSRSFSSPEKKELILPSSYKNIISNKEQTLFFSEPTISVDGDLVSFLSQGDNTEASYDLSDALDYHPAFPLSKKENAETSYDLAESLDYHLAFPE